MKKIISLLLLLATATMLLAGCKRASKKDIEKVNECYNRSYPHKIVVESTQQFGAQSLVSTTELTRGMIGVDFVAKEKVSREQLRSVEDGSGTDVLPYVETVREERWFRVGVGVSTDKGQTWDAAAENFFPSKGVFALNLDSSLMDDVKYNNGTLTFTVTKDNVKNFFGAGFGVIEDVKVEIRTGGGFVTSVLISWVEAQNLSTGVEMVSATIKADYYYDQQKISFD